VSDERVTIDRRFNGPPDSGNGGYVCGLLAGRIDGAAEVTLRRPPPLDTPLRIERLESGAVALRDVETLIAEGAPASVEIEVPQPLTYAEAQAASNSYPGHEKHIFDQCFVCGPRRGPGDGLRIFPGWVAGRKLVAAPWTPDPSLAGEGGAVRPEFVWASLDCPGAWAMFDEKGFERAVVLGRLAARLLAPVRPGEPCVVVGWPLGEDGRKLYAGTALFGEDGDLRAFARATWVRIA
jgi:hypothetical protein